MSNDIYSHIHSKQKLLLERILKEIEVLLSQKESPYLEVIKNKILCVLNEK